MVSNPEFDLSAALEAHRDEILEWSDPSDLSAMSREAMFAQAAHEPGRTIKSRGFLRLFGEHVAGHSIDLEVVGWSTHRLQNLADAVGAAIEGQIGLRGKLSDDILRRTRLQLRAQPIPGSVVLQIEPAETPAADLYPEGQVPVIDPPTSTLADQAMETVIALLGDAANASDPLGEEWIERVSVLGPRVASALRALTDNAGREGISFGLTWREPGHPSMRASVRPDVALYMSQLLANNELDGEVVELEGHIHTISDRRPLDLELDSGEVVELRRDVDSPSDEALSELTYGARVFVIAKTTVRSRIGEDDSLSYRLISIRLVDSDQ